ncbi:hypothetical protein WJR50_07275 [Catalinimonas sp. 4WD22]|uniref:hypothetical protein n=1 Tax=Catalinimonas locisalis TaxID=3133978 RepID=UPI00310163FD
MKTKFFLTPYETPEKANYQHLAVALAEGLKDLQIQFYGNIDYWFCLDSNEYLIKSAPENFEADIHVYSTLYFRSNSSFFFQDDKINVLLDASDGIFTPAQDPAFKRFNYILRTHYNRHFYYPDNVLPWAFGLTKRMINSSSAYTHLEKTIDILQNFRVDHSLRKYMIDHLNPRLSKYYDIREIITNSAGNVDPHSYWAQTGRRHDEKYFQLINSSRYTYVFGGDFQPKPLISSFYGPPHRLGHRLKRKVLNMLQIKSKYLVYLNQFDSWRLWEGFCSSTVPIHLDLKEYGCIMPIMPQNGVHYLGIEDANQLENFSEKLKALTNNKLCEIAENGRQWSLENYGPEATAKRFLKIVSRSETTGGSSIFT